MFDGKSWSHIVLLRAAVLAERATEQFENLAQRAIYDQGGKI